LAVLPSHSIPPIETLVIAEASLPKEPTSRKSTALIDAEFGEAVVEDDSNAAIGIVKARYDSYLLKKDDDDPRGRPSLDNEVHAPRRPPARWAVEETRMFYRALRMCGTDFGMMKAFIGGRTREQIRRKFKQESKRNPRLVDMSLDPRYARRVKLDLTAFGELEIPDTVPTINPAYADNAKKEEAANDDDNVAKKEEPGDDEEVVVEDAEDDRSKTGGGNGSRNVERKFDALFDDDDTGAEGGEKTEESTEEGSGNADGGYFAKEAKARSRPVLAAAAKRPVAAGKKSPAAAKAKSAANEPAVVPLAPVAPLKKKAKKARFKAMPNGMKRTKKKR